MPPVIAYHLMWTLYGWWLPNDPRGSTSTTIRSDLLRDLGELHLGRKRVQPPGHEVRAFYQSAASQLKHALLSFHPNDFAQVAKAIETAVNQRGYTCYAAAIMPDHLHLLIRKHRDRSEDMIERIQHISREQLIEMSLRTSEHPTWTRGGWKVYLDSRADVERTIEYIEANPVKMRLSRQVWPWVTPYDGWPHHPR